MTPSAISGRAQQIVGGPHLTTDTETLAAYAVDGVRPAAAAQPGTPEEAAGLLAAAGDLGAGVLPRGAGVHQHLGGTPSRADLIIETTRFVGITDYTPADYVVAARAGTRLRDLQAELANHGQWLPLDPPGGRQATIGGLIAANRNGPRRLLWGALRDMLIGVRVALPTGEVIKAGGKVVKNVAGYDLTKLFIGSLGAVGVITDATFKISPLPGEGLTIFLTVPGLVAAHELTTAVMRSYLLPSALEAANPVTFRRLSALVGRGDPPSGSWGVLMLVEGMAESRARHVAEMKTLLGPRAKMEVIEGAEHDALWAAIAEFPSPETHPGSVVSRVGGPIAQWADVARAVSSVRTVARPVEVLAHAGVGLLYTACADVDGPGMVDALGRAAAKTGGYTVVEVAPPALKARLSVWGSPPGGLDLMRRLREKFDPRGVMVPGRLGWGL